MQSRNQGRTATTPPQCVYQAAGEWSAPKNCTRTPAKTTSSRDNRTRHCARRDAPEYTLDWPPATGRQTDNLRIGSSMSAGWECVESDDKSRQYYRYGLRICLAQLAPAEVVSRWNNSTHTYIHIRRSICIACIGCKQRLGRENLKESSTQCVTVGCCAECYWQLRNGSLWDNILQ